MHADVATILDRIRRHGVEHDGATPDRRDRFRNLEPASAALLGVLVRAIGARSALELGTSNGYSTLWIADALRATGGRLITVDVDAARAAMARDHLEQAGLVDIVDMRVEDALDTLDRSADGQFDFIFLDAERTHYTAYWPGLRRTLRPGGLLAVDNVLSHADQVQEFRALIAATPGVHEAVAPTGAGVLLVVNGAPAPAR